MDSISGNVSGRVDCSFAGDADRIGNAHRIAGVNVPPDLARRPAGNRRARRSSGASAMRTGLPASTSRRTWPGVLREISARGDRRVGKAEWRSDPSFGSIAPVGPCGWLRPPAAAPNRLPDGP